jgi:serine/threonine-protein kinase
VYKDAQAPELPARLGRYELLAPIASGGMAEVFAARVVGDPAPAKLVAIKRMKEELLGEARFVSMFLDEARIAAHLSHPNVVGLEDLGRTEQGVPYLVMDLVVGASVAELLRGDPGLERKAVPLEIAVELIAQAAEGLHAAHEAKDALGTPLEIVHRDVSPQNILVGLDGRARISDFGIARAVARLTRTATGELKGKARYFSPEQAHGKDADRRSDLFALGVVLWEMLALQPLCSGRSLPEVLRAVSAHAVPDVRDRRPEVPEPVARVLARSRGTSRRALRPGRSSRGAFEPRRGTPASERHNAWRLVATWSRGWGSRSRGFSRRFARAARCPSTSPSRATPRCATTPASRTRSRWSTRRSGEGPPHLGARRQLDRGAWSRFPIVSRTRACAPLCRRLSRRCARGRWRPRDRARGCGRSRSA